MIEMNLMNVAVAWLFAGMGIGAVMGVIAAVIRTQILAK